MNIRNLRIDVSKFFLVFLTVLASCSVNSPEEKSLYKISYFGNGADSGDVPVDVNSYQEDSEVLIQLSGTLERHGYLFIGWAEDPEATHPDYQEGVTLTMPGKNLSLYAIWSPMSGLNVFYYGNNCDNPDSVPQDNTLYYEGDNITISGPGNMMRYGYSFAGWSESGNSLTGNISADDILEMGSESFHLYAIWQLKHLESFTLSNLNISSVSGSTLTIDPVFYPADVLEKTVLWSTNNPNFASVDENGNITCLRPGTAVISAIAVDGNFQTSCSIKVDYTPESFFKFIDNGSDITITGLSDDYWTLDEDLKDTIAIPETVSGKPVLSIGANTFENCSQLNSLYLPVGIKTIKSNALDGLENLSTLYLSESINTIEMYGITKCSSLQELFLPQNVTSLGVIESLAIYENPSLERINVSPANPNYTSIDGVLYSKNQEILITYPASNSSATFTVPENVKEISTFGISSCENLQSLVLPKNFNIGTGPIYRDCNSLKEILVDLANTEYQSIDGVLFNSDKSIIYRYPQAKNLTEYITPATVTELGSWAFYCSALSKIEIPSSVTVLGLYCFDGCESLEELVLNATSVPTSFSDLFPDSPSSLKIFVPDASVNDYKTAWAGYSDQIYGLSEL